MIHIFYLPLICALNFIVPHESSYLPKEAIVIDGYAFNHDDVEILTSDIFYNKINKTYFLYKTCSVKITELNENDAVEKLLKHLNENKLSNLISENK